MHWSALLVIALLVGVVASSILPETAVEGFTAPRRSDIGYAADGWTEEGGWSRDVRYKEQFVDIQGLGVSADFCRAVSKKGNPGTLQIACALGRRDGMDTMEYRSHTVKEGLRMSRDDYWKANGDGNRMDYCRILKDEDTGHWYSSCLEGGRTGFKKQEARDTNPPYAIKELLDAYHGIMTWWRWSDDKEDYAQNAGFEVHGTPVFPELLNPTVSRGLQLNRWPLAAQEAGEQANHTEPRDYLRWGESKTLKLEQTIQPRQMRAIAFWVYWDSFEKGATVFEASNGRKKDRIWLGIQGPSRDGPTPTQRVATPAAEIPPATLQAIGQMTEPARPLQHLHPNQRLPVNQHSKTATYVFEIWDEEQRIMRLESPMGAAKVGVWQHIVVTTTNDTAWWPEWQLWIDGTLVASRTDGRLSPALELSQNFIGRGVRGCLQDFRIYKTHLSPAKVKAAMSFSKEKLHPLP